MAWVWFRRDFKPRDKAKVESAFSWPSGGSSRRCAIESSSHRRLNQAIRELRDRINQRPFRKREGLAASQFGGSGQARAESFAPEPFDLSQWSRARVNIALPHRFRRELLQRSLQPGAGVGWKCARRPRPSSFFTKGQRVASHPPCAWSGAHRHCCEHRPRSTGASEWTPSPHGSLGRDHRSHTARLFRADHDDKPHPRDGLSGFWASSAWRTGTPRNGGSGSERALLTGACRTKASSPS